MFVAEAKRLDVWFGFQMVANIAFAGLPLGPPGAFGLKNKVLLGAFPYPALFYTLLGRLNLVLLICFWAYEQDVYIYAFNFLQSCFLCESPLV